MAGDKIVYLVQHVHEMDDDEDVKVIGIYSSQKNAEAAVERLKLIQGFKDAKEGFYIDEYKLDHDHWTEGYVTLNPGE